MIKTIINITQIKITIIHCYILILIIIIKLIILIIIIIIIIIVGWRLHPIFWWRPAANHYLWGICRHL